ncbi:HORMA domain containing protein, putative [Babesia bigemina]|uniref:HORMA domain containing protein, putative n=1 Tax=Babesia bigemina TaxID=5866 RepID=A0A061D802_BABBI|nr:HORMA domain containing protein, putative [Babesia bigemina]CDR95054.1 HORMA domain containing protein, putative [Babesia bigemina]|eukprot:XP_012767240.1 HORMA domain containing protein, putative [Babesia bigemina]
MSTISSQESANVLRNFVKVGVSSIAYLRNLFAESVFEDTVIGGLQLKRLTRSVPESAALLDWIDDGVFDAMGREYLKHLVVSIHNSEHLALETYTFSLQYGSDEDSCDGVRSEYSVQMSVGHGPLADCATAAGGNSGGRVTNGVSNPANLDNASEASSNSTAPLATAHAANTLTTSARPGCLVVSADKEEVKRQTVKVLRDLVLLAQSLSPLPDNRYLSMRLMYYDERVPVDYEPQHFRSASAESFGEAELSLEQQVGALETGHHNLAVDVRSVCYVDENVTNYKSSVRPFDTLTRRTSISCAKPAEPPQIRDPAADLSRQPSEAGASHVRLPAGSSGRGNGVQVPAPRPPVGGRNVMLGLLKRSYELAARTKFISKECLTDAMGVDATTSKALLKNRMIEHGYIDSRFIKGKGYM